MGPTAGTGDTDTAAFEPTTVGDVIAGAAFLVLLAPVAGRLAALPWGGSDLVLFATAVALGIAATDLTSGVVHWFCDTFFAEDTPVLGPALIQPFREHHRDPLAITRRGFLRVNRSNLIAMSAVLLLVGQGPTEAATSFGEVWLVSYACAVILTNQFHKWAHASRVPWGVRRLQAWRIVVSPSHHARHHEGRGAHAYCVTTGWLNPMLDGLGVFASLTRAIRGVAARARQVAL